MSNRLSLPSFGKINWLLKVLGRRVDGYHEVRTVCQTIDLRDEMVFEVNSGSSIELEVHGRGVAKGESNLVHRAAEVLRTAVGSSSGARLRLGKKIPIGAGLGGGAGNAAVALLALNQLWGCRLELDQLARLGARLGSDVPLFLWGGTTLGLGRGEEVFPWPDRIPEQSVLLLYPNLEIPTGEAYSLGNWGSRVLTIKASDTRIDRFRKAVEERKKGWAYLENDFESPLLKKYPLLVEASQGLKSAGCERVMLCGSGSTLLGLAAPRHLEKAAETILQRKLGEVFLCHTLSRQKYQRILKDCGLDVPVNRSRNV